ncbi:hypothetical protein GC175_14300 [bacterium]|nr:hypothetical protein [bacterium]
MSNFYLTLFGTFDLSVDGEPASTFRSDRARALLAFLAAERGQVHRRQALADLFWPDLPESAARANLRNVLSNLRTIFDAVDPQPLVITRHDVAFHPAPGQVDLLAFAELLAQSQSTTVFQMETVEKAVALYAGDFLAGFVVDGAPAFQEWCVVRQERCHQQALTALQQLAAHFQVHGNPTQVADVAHRLLVLEPWHEGAHRLLMASLAARGQQAAALAQYERCCAVLAEELGVEPDESTQALARRIRGEDSVTSSPPRTNLSVVNTSFVGREEQVNALAARCAPGGTRLVTLLGLGGVGKSRLAQAVGQRLLEQYRDGVWWVPLEAIHPGDDVEIRLAVAVAAALGIPLQGSGNPLEHLFGHLRRRRLLLIHDNFEQIAASAGFLHSLLTAAPHVSVLVTSRERLNLPGEEVHRLGGLDPAAAAALFVSRAEAVNVHFAPDDAERQAIAKICARVEGLPLGIELAAVWTEHFSCTEIADAIADRDDLLARQGDQPVARHDSLRVVFEHSWRLLSHAEQWTLAQLAVFEGEFGRTAFLTIVDAGLSELSALSAKSLVRLVGAGRYTLHAVVRSFAAQKLGQSAAEAQTDLLCRYRTYFLRLLHMHDMPLRQQELANIRAAWVHAVDVRDDALLAEACEEFAELLRSLGLVESGMALLQRARAGADGNLAAALLLQIGRMVRQIQGAPAALGVLKEGLSYATDDVLRFDLSQRTANLLFEIGNWRDAAEVHAQLVAAARRGHDPLLLARAQYHQAIDHVLHFVGDYGEAIKQMIDALTLLNDDPKAINLRFEILHGLVTGNVRYGNYGQALVYAQEAKILAQTHNRRFEQIDAEIDLGLGYGFAGLYAEAIAHAETGLALAEEDGDHEARGLFYANLCLFHRNAGNLAQSFSCGQKGLALLQALEIRRLEGLCRTRLGHCLLALGRHPEAVEMYTAAVEIWHLLDNPNRYEAKAGLAVALTALGETQQSAVLAAEVLSFAAMETLQRVVEPVQMLVHTVHVLQTLGHSDGVAILTTLANTWIETIALRNEDPAIRHAYRTQIPAHQALHHVKAYRDPSFRS